ncbi:hypothetical protein NC00_09340 [Xanthomonas cannabis pv. phaseoli]|uniref:Secreted protein n=1 Tax=Xanthomonas cannabis pv. phaseoli TaxID=1885902 RepID=A0AB34PAM3_9XANT|nr:hypothetical protein NC00_09340 [Xanthomonas cannabis pv. phaseoli]PPU32365.1 hypothetical protein XspCFBP7912_12180 [Xanthomonas sp. CFBP 7912]RJS04827.1 hypothetical protein XnspCFBP7698_00745 [Xanthomonas sp. CFBP 7698]
MILIATLTLGLLMNHPSAANQPVGDTPHNGLSLQALERAYIESYEQSGFRLANRRKQSYPNGAWNIELVFQLKSAPKGRDSPSTTLSIFSRLPPKCGCIMRRESFLGADANSPDREAYMRGERALVKADRAALAKVQRRLGSSIPYAGPAEP